MVTLGLKFDYEISKTRAFIKFASSPTEGPAVLAFMRQPSTKPIGKTNAKKVEKIATDFRCILSYVQEIYRASN